VHVSLSQVRRLLRSEGLSAPGGGRRRSRMDSDEEDDGVPAGSVMYGVDVKRLEALYQTYVAQEDFLSQVCSSSSSSRESTQQRCRAAVHNT
jgi:hypothetical protein